MKTRTLHAYFLIVFGLSWSLAGIFILFPERITAVFGKLSMTNPLFFVATHAPALAAFYLVLRHGGWSGLKAFLSRLLLWRAHWAWYVWLLFGIPLCFYLGAGLKGLSPDELFPFTSVRELLPLLVLMLLLGPVEEFGWRGFALPLLQRTMAPLWAALVLGLIWGIWHLPAFLLSDTPQANWAFMPFLIGSVSISVIVTALFNSSGGSLLLPILFHWQLNNPAWPDAQPWDHLAFAAAAVVVVILFRRNMFDKHWGLKEVMPGTGDEAGSDHALTADGEDAGHQA